jgi:solute carrier family 25 thiamine pyrophosphate transporter 19
VRDEGLTALWKGNVPAEALYVGYGAAQFLAYRLFSQLLDRAAGSAPLAVPLPRLGPGARSFAAGAAAGAVATTLTYPLDLLRTRFAAAGRDRVYRGLVAGVAEIHAQEGARGFFRGLGAANVQIVPYMGLFFAAYEALRPALADSGLPLAWMGTADGAAALLASVLSKTAVYPLDTVRKRLQVQGPSRRLYVHRNIPEYRSGVLGTVKDILRKEGVRGMYRGLTVGLAKAAPASAVTMWTFERVMATMRYIESRETV